MPSGNELLNAGSSKDNQQRNLEIERGEQVEEEKNSHVPDLAHAGLPVSM